MPLAAAATGRIRVVMIGTGHGHAASKIKALQSMGSEYEFLGICRPYKDDPAVGEIFSKFPELSVDKVLTDNSVDLLATEFADPNRNLEFATAAIDTGKYVHLDKPPGADLAKLQALLNKAIVKKRVVQMGYQWRYHPAMQAAIDAARKGYLGRVYRFRAAIDKLIDADERRHLAKYRGGMMFSEGCHLVDRATATFGKPDRVTGFIHHHAPQQDGLADDCLMVLEYPNAIAEVSLAGFDANGNQHRLLELQGTNGIARVQPYTATKLTIEVRDGVGPYSSGVQTIETAPNGTGVTYTPDFAEMAAIIRKGAKPSYSPAHDLNTHRVLLEGCGML